MIDYIQYCKELFPDATVGEKKLFEELEVKRKKFGFIDMDDYSIIGKKRPERKELSYEIRANTLRALLLANEKLAVLVGESIAIQGAYISGKLDLNACKNVRFLNLKACTFEEKPDLTGVRMYGLQWEEVHSPGLMADYSHFDTIVCLIENCEFTNTVNLSGSHICGGLRFNGSKILCVKYIESKKGWDKSVKPVSEETEQTAYMTSMAIDASYITVGHEVSLSYGFSAVGEISFHGASIDGDFIVEEKTSLKSHSNTPSDSVPEYGDSALRLNNATIKGTFFLRTETQIEGHLLMYSASVDGFNTEWDIWPEGKIGLVGFTYQRLESVTIPNDKAIMLFLKKQCAYHLKTQKEEGTQGFASGFRPQPWRQMAKILNDTGHDRSARNLLVNAEELYREDERQRMSQKPLLRFFSWIWSSFLKSTVSYGYRQYRAGIWLVALVLVGGFVFDWAYGLQLMETSSKNPLPFEPWVFSLEKFGPIGGFGQDKY